jgi:fructokinase
MKVVSIGEILFDCFPDKKVIGGAPFNFIYHIKKLTDKAEFISRIGDDENGNSVIKFLEKNNINSHFIQIDTEHQTGTVNVKVDDQGIPTFNIVANCAYDFIDHSSEIEKLIDSDTSLLYFGTLAQRNKISRKTIQSLLEKQIKYFYDINLRNNYYSKEILSESLKKINVLKLNEDELKIVSELFLSTHFELNASAKALLEKFELEMLSVTLGAKGALLMDRNNSNRNEYSPTRVVDTVGAGDAYAAILCLGYLKKLPIERINFLANKFAAFVCGITGALPSTDEIYDQFKEELS